jgi:hypothetical protein
MVATHRPGAIGEEAYMPKPVVVRLNARDTLRLAQLVARADGSAQTAQSAVGVAEHHAAQLRTEVDAKLRARKTTVPEGWHTHLDIDAGTVTIRPPGGS